MPVFLGDAADLGADSAVIVGLSGLEPGCRGAELYCIGAGTVGWGAATAVLASGCWSGTVAVLSCLAGRSAVFSSVSIFRTRRTRSDR